MSPPSRALASAPGAVNASKALVRRYWSDASARGLDAVTDAVFAPDVVSHPPRSVCPQPLVGLDAFRGFLAGGFFGAFPDLHVDVEDLVAEGDLVAARVMARGTHLGELMGLKPTHRRVDIPGIELFRFVAGRIVEQWGWPDALGLLQQLSAPLPTRSGA